MNTSFAYTYNESISHVGGPLCRSTLKLGSAPGNITHYEHELTLSSYREKPWTSILKTLEKNAQKNRRHFVYVYKAAWLWLWLWLWTVLSSSNVSPALRCAGPRSCAHFACNHLGLKMARIGTRSNKHWHIMSWVKTCQNTEKQENKRNITSIRLTQPTKIHQPTNPTPCVSAPGSMCSSLWEWHCSRSRISCRSCGTSSCGIPPPGQASRERYIYWHIVNGPANFGTVDIL